MGSKLRLFKEKSFLRRVADYFRFIIGTPFFLVFVFTFIVVQFVLVNLVGLSGWVIAGSSGRKEAQDVLR
jgi:uncharacterized membrane protein